MSCNNTWSGCVGSGFCESTEEDRHEIFKANFVGGVVSVRLYPVVQLTTVPLYSFQSISSQIEML